VSDSIWLLVENIDALPVLGPTQPKFLSGTWNLHLSRPPRPK
jgi:hypothetical protein